MKIEDLSPEELIDVADACIADMQAKNPEDLSGIAAAGFQPLHVIASIVEGTLRTLQKEYGPFYEDREEQAELREAVWFEMRSKFRPTIVRFGQTVNAGIYGIVMVGAGFPEKLTESQQQFIIKLSDLIEDVAIYKRKESTKRELV